LLGTEAIIRPTTEADQPSYKSRRSPTTGADQPSFWYPREMDAPPSLEQPARNWSELPLEPLHSVFSKLGVVDLLMGAGLVCHSWLEEAKQPDLWRSVHTRHHHKVLDMSAGDLREMLKAAVDRSAGGLEVFVGDWFLTDNLLKYIGDRYYSLGTRLSY
jgi:hypothetical protein